MSTAKRHRDPLTLAQRAECISLVGDLLTAFPDGFDVQDTTRDPDAMCSKLQALLARLEQHRSLLTGVEV